MKTNNKQLKERFEEKFGSEGLVVKIGWGLSTDPQYKLSDVWDFFSKEIDKVRNETIDECLGVLERKIKKGLTKNIRQVGFYEGLDFAVESLKELYDTTK